MINAKAPLWIALLLAVAVGSCKKPDKDIEFKGVQNIKLKKVSGKNAYLSAEAVFHNPNSMGMKLRKVEVALFLEGKKVANVNQDKNVRIGPNTDFTVPLDVKFDIQESGLLDNIFSFLGGKKYEVRYTGYIKGSVYGIPFRAPIDHKDEIKLK